MTALAADLRHLLHHSQVVDAPAELRTYAYDASFYTQLAPQSPDVAVIAGSEADVVAVMRYAHQHGVPVTPRGAASGQTGGCVALRGGIVLALNALNRIVEIDVPNMQALCEPGVVHAQLNEQLAKHKLIFPPDPGSTRMATVGGMASNNAHGMRAVKYGPTGAWVLGLRAVLPDGTLIETGGASGHGGYGAVDSAGTNGSAGGHPGVPGVLGTRAKQSSAGLELTKLFVGAEGTLGVFTQLRLKLVGSSRVDLQACKLEYSIVSPK